VVLVVFKLDVTTEDALVFRESISDVDEGLTEFVPTWVFEIFVKEGLISVTTPACPKLL
jgi:hypothetical protein